MPEEIVPEQHAPDGAAPKPSGRGGLMIALSFIAGLVLLVALNMR